MVVRVDDSNQKLARLERDARKLDRLVEEICLLGCDTVNATIAQIGEGQVPEVAHKLSAQQLVQLRIELEEIMAPLQH